MQVQLHHWRDEVLSCPVAGAASPPGRLKIGGICPLNGRSGQGSTNKIGLVAQGGPLHKARTLLPAPGLAQSGQLVCFVSVIFVEIACSALAAQALLMLGRCTPALMCRLQMRPYIEAVLRTAYCTKWCMMLARITQPLGLSLLNNGYYSAALVWCHDSHRHEIKLGTSGGTSNLGIWVGARLGKQLSL